MLGIGLNLWAFVRARQENSVSRHEWMHVSSLRARKAGHQMPC